MTGVCSSSPVLEAERLALKLGGRWLCRDLSFTLECGECLVVLGPNGAGKTTLLHTLAGLQPAAQGEVRLGGRPYAAWSALEAARFRAVLMQRQPDHFSATVLETVLVGRHPHVARWEWESEADVAVARQALADVGLQGFAERDVMSLSGGERQRVAMAALLAQAPQLFLLDEPLNHLDLRYQIAFLQLLRGLLRGDNGGAPRAAVLVLHDINLAARIADQVVLFDGRGGVSAGRREQMMSVERLSAAFDHPLRHVGGADGGFFVPYWEEQAEGDA